MTLAGLQLELNSAASLHVFCQVVQDRLLGYHVLAELWQGFLHLNFAGNIHTAAAVSHLVPQEFPVNTFGPPLLFPFFLAWGTGLQRLAGILLTLGKVM